MAKNINRKVTIYINGKEVENTLKGMKAELNRLQNEQRRATLGSREYIETTEKISTLKKYIDDQTEGVVSLGSKWEDTADKLAKYSNILMGVQSAFEMLDIGIGKMKDLAKDAAALDDVYADVMKTTGMTHEQVESMNKALLKMDTRTSREQLNQLAYEAGKLGISSEEMVLQFVSASDKINIALGDVLGDGAMVTVGKLTNIYEGVSKTLDGKNLEEKMLAIGSAVNSLGQASTANEGYLVEFMKRLGGIAAQAGMSADQILGYASALDQNGQAVEMSATAFMKLIQQMVKKPGEFVSAAGMSMEEFKKLMDEDMNGAVQRVLEGMENGGGFQQLIGLFADMGLDGARAATVVSSLAKHLDQVREAQTLAYQEMMTGNSVMNEFNVKNETLQAKAEKAKKRFEEVRIELGEELYPVLIHLQKSGTVLMSGISGAVQIMKECPGIIAPITAAVLALYKARVATAMLWLKERPQAISEWIQRKKNTRETLKQAAAEAKTRKVRAEALVVRIKDKVEIEKSIIAKRAELVATGQGNRVVEAEIRLRKLNIAATKAEAIAVTSGTAAIKASSAAMNAIPFVAVMAAIAALIPKIQKLVKERNRVADATKEANRQYFEENGRLKVLFETLKNTTNGSAEYIKAIGVLKQEYPDLIKQHINEKGELKSLEDAYNSLSAAAKNSIYERMFAQETGKVYAEVEEQLGESMKSASKYIDRLMRKYSEEERGMVKERINSALAELSSGEKGIADMYKVINEAIRRAIGNKNFTSGYLPWVVDLGKEADKAKRTVAELRVELNADPEDKWETGKKSVAELNSELEEAERNLKRYEKAVDSGKSEFAEMAEEERRHIYTLKKAIGELGDEMAVMEEGADGSGGGGTTSGKETAEQKKARLAQEAWERFENGYSRMMEKMEAKTLTGADKVVADVDNSIQKMLDDLQAVLAKHPEAKQMMEDLRGKAAEWKNAQLDAYIKKMTDELARQQGKLKEMDSEGNDYINKMMDAQRKLTETLANYDAAIATAESDMISLMAQQSGASESEQGNLQKQIDKLRELIAQYGVLKGKVTARAFDAITTGSTNASSMGIRGNQWRNEVSAAVEGRRKSGLGMMFDEGAFNAYGQTLEEIYQKYDKQKKAIAEARKANVQMLKEQRTLANTDPQNAELKERIRLRKEEIDRLNAEEGELDDLMATALKAAEEDAFGRGIDRWISGIEEFGQQVVQLWGNINTILDNIAQKELNDAKKLKEENEKQLEEQLEEGLISEEEYEERKEELQDEYDALEEEKELAQWKRQKALNIGEATMQGALAVLKALSSAPPPYNAILAGISSALAAVQIAAIASEPEPYARGGYVNEDTTFYRAGEAGREWVASSRLLKDGSTAPIIQALEDYQRGNSRALTDISMARLDMPAALSASESIGRSQAVAQPQSAAAVWNHPTAVSVGNDSREMVSLMRDLVKYQKDPKNRQAVISRRTMDDFDNNENFLRSRARL